MLAVARRLHELGFLLVGTRGTALYLFDHGVPAQLAYKVGEGRPHVFDLIRNSAVQLLINTPLGEMGFYDDKAIRLAAGAHGVACITTLSAAEAAVQAIERARAGQQLLHWDGKTWSDQPGPIKTYIDRIPALADGTLLAIGGQGTLWWRQAGAWKPGPPLVKLMPTLGTAWASGPNDVWQLGAHEAAFGAPNGVQHWNGGQWQLLPDPPLVNGQRIWGAGPAHVFVAG